MLGLGTDLSLTEDLGGLNLENEAPKSFGGVPHKLSNLSSGVARNF